MITIDPSQFASTFLEENTFKSVDLDFLSDWNYEEFTIDGKGRRRSYTETGSSLSAPTTARTQRSPIRNPHDKPRWK